MSNKFFRQNLTMHILAALLALVMWSFVKTSDTPLRTENTQTIHGVALEYRDIPEHLRLTNTPPQNVTVTLRGASQLLEQVVRGDLLAHISLADAAEGTGQYVIKLNVPQGLTATVIPSRVDVRLEQVLTADFPVEALTNQRIIRDQYVSIALNPSYVRVTGVRSSVARLSKAVVSIDLPASVNDTTLRLPFRLVGVDEQEVTGLIAEPGIVDVTVKLWPKRELPVGINLIGELGDDYELVSASAEPATVSVFGPPDRLSGVQLIQTSPVNLSGITADTEVVASLTLPEWMVLANEEAATVKVKLQIKER